MFANNSLMIIINVFTIGFIILTWNVKNIYCVRITNLSVPRGASHEAPLDCKYDMQDSQLYDVKWYKDNLQFFRCLASGEVQLYPVDGVKVYHTNFASIGSCPLTLMGLSSQSAGEYKCEVSTEGPDFRTAVQYAKLKIIQPLKRTQTTNRTDNRADFKDTNEIPVKITKQRNNTVNRTTSGITRTRFNFYITYILLLLYLFFGKD